MVTSQQPDDYRSLAAYYDLIYAQSGPDDAQFYLDWAERQAEAGSAGTDGVGAGPGSEGAAILELGCGTGRITLPLARAGHRVTALDISPSMLDILCGKLGQEPAEVQARVDVVQGDMAEFSLPVTAGQSLAAGTAAPPASQFSLIIAPFRAFQHLMEPEQQRAMLTRVRGHLAPGGVYIHDQFEPSYRYIIENMQRGLVWQLDTTVDLPDGGIVQRFHIPRYDLGRQRLDVDFRVDEYGPDMVLRRSVLERIAMRMTHRQEIFYLLELCGLKVVEAYGGYQGEPLGPEIARELVLACQAA